jgi:flagellar hook assembly protein FlgD
LCVFSAYFLLFSGYSFSAETSAGNTVISASGSTIIYMNNNEQVIISCQSVDTGNITVKIYNAEGLLVKNMSEDVENPYDFPDIYFKWACDDSEGNKVASGKYTVFVEGPGIKIEKRIIIVR